MVRLQRISFRGFIFLMLVSFFLVGSCFADKKSHDFQPFLLASSTDFSNEKSTHENNLSQDDVITDQGDDQNIFLDGEDDPDLDSVFDAAEDEDENIYVEEKKSLISFGGSLKNETAYRLDDPHDFSKIKNVLTLNSSGRVTDSISFVLEGRFSYDAVFDVNDRYNSDVESDQEKTADLRNAYLDLNIGKIDLRLGNQQIVWGQAVGLFFADVVNPKDLREYILPELDQARIPVLAANAEIYISDTYLQFIFIPFPEFNEFGKPGAEFDFSKPLYNQDADIVYNGPQSPDNSLDNSEIGVRVNKLVDGWDLSIFYLYDYYNFPVNYRTVELNPTGSVHPVTLRYQTEYERMHRAGATFSKEYFDIVFKGELIYSSDMFYSCTGLGDEDGIIESPSFEWLIGFDYTFFKKIESNFQLLQAVVLDHQSDIEHDEYATSFSVWLKTGFFDNKIEPELFFITSFNDTDGMIRPKINYKLNNNLNLMVGMDLFYGDTDGNFGIFDSNDRAYFEMKYSF